MKQKVLAPLGAIALALSGCNSGGGGGSSSGEFDVVRISNGFGTLVPHQVFRADEFGDPTPEVIAITKTEDLIANVNANNPIFAPTSWDPGTKLPNGATGNHFIFVEFNRSVDIRSILDSTPQGQANSGLLGTIVLLAYDPSTGTSSSVTGRAFVGGRTFTGSATDPADGEPWVVAQGTLAVPVDENGDGMVDQNDGGFGFPNHPGSAKLVQDNVFVFVPDQDGDLSTFETFPANRQIAMRVSTAVTDMAGEFLARAALGSSTVGPDGLAPELRSTPPPNSVADITPSDQETDVDPTQPIILRFTEPVQPFSIGQLDDGSFATLSSWLQINFGPANQLTNVPFSVMPISVYDLSEWEVRPGFSFPGQGPANLPCSTFNEIRITTNGGQLQDLSTAGNLNQLTASASFFTGQGPGLINAPVAPDVIYAGRQGAVPSVSVIDLNGFGQSTGDPTYDFLNGTVTPDQSNFPNNTNVLLQGGQLRPPLAPGTCTVDGGSNGVFSLTRDSNLDNRLLRPPVVTQIGEMMLGQPLDTVFNNGLEPLGCQGGGGNLCAIRGQKLVSANLLSSGGNQIGQGLIPAQWVSGNVATTPVTNVVGGENAISFAPHPNPPPLAFPPLCQTPFIAGQEPSSADHVLSLQGLGFNGAAALTNLLGPGDPLGNPAAGIRPSGLLTAIQNAFFEGPSQGGIPLANCQPYSIRQQVGHFLYVVDPARREIVVVNSNRFSVIDRIPVSDPTDLAMSPNLDFLAVTNQASDTVTFIDTDPASVSFHQVVKNTSVGRAPRGIAWDPGNEDVLVCNEGSSNMSVISAFDLNVRNTVSNTLDRPFDIAITQRQGNFGFLRNVYFAWILNRSGVVSIFESGPNGPNGWGFDDVVGTVPFTFDNPRKIAVNHLDLNGSVWVVHENPLDSEGIPTGATGGALTNVYIASANSGPQLLSLQIFGSVLSLRDLGFAVRPSVTQTQLTGVPVDIAFDNMVNLGAMTNVITNFSSGFPTPLNGRSLVKDSGFNAIRVTNQSQFMLVAVPNSSEGPGVVDVIDVGGSGFQRVDTNAFVPGVQSIPVPGVTFLCDYFRQ